MSEVEIDTTRMDRNGRFKCPKCGELIDPDKTGEYEILGEDIKLDNNDWFKIKHKCGQVIKIMVWKGGFAV